MVPARLSATLSTLRPCLTFCTGFPVLPIPPILPVLPLLRSASYLSHPSYPSCRSYTQRPTRPTVPGLLHAQGALASAVHNLATIVRVFGLYMFGRLYVLGARYGVPQVRRPFSSPPDLSQIFPDLCHVYPGSPQVSPRTSPVPSRRLAPFASHRRAARAPLTMGMPCHCSPQLPYWMVMVTQLAAVALTLAIPAQQWNLSKGDAGKRGGHRGAAGAEAAEPAAPGHPDGNGPTDVASPGPSS